MSQALRQTIERALKGLLLPPLIDLVWGYYFDPTIIFLFLEPKQVECVEDSDCITYFTITDYIATFTQTSGAIWTCKAIGLLITETNYIREASLLSHEYRAYPTTPYHCCWELF
jgi:hypothetical protein